MFGKVGWHRTPWGRASSQRGERTTFSSCCSSSLTNKRVATQGRAVHVSLLLHILVVFIFHAQFSVSFIYVCTGFTRLHSFVSDSRVLRVCRAAHSTLTGHARQDGAVPHSPCSDCLSTCCEHYQPKYSLHTREPEFRPCRGMFRASNSLGGNGRILSLRRLSGILASKSGGATWRQHIHYSPRPAARSSRCENFTGASETLAFLYLRIL